MSAPDSYRFGPFELQRAQARLLREGQPAAVPPMPFKLLCLLLENSDRLVTREEIRVELWPDRVVEYDQSLNFCVRQLRRTLDDDADSPRYIETVPRRGFRWVAPVQAVEPRGRRKRRVVIGAAILAAAALIPAGIQLTGGRSIQVDVAPTVVTGVNLPGFVAGAFTERLRESLREEGFAVSTDSDDNEYRLSTEVAAADNATAIVAGLYRAGEQIWRARFEVDAPTLAQLEPAFHSEIATALKRLQRDSPAHGAGPTGTDTIERVRTVPRESGDG